MARQNRHQYQQQQARRGTVPAMSDTTTTGANPVTETVNASAGEKPAVPPAPSIDPQVAAARAVAEAMGIAIPGDVSKEDLAKYKFLNPAHLQVTLDAADDLRPDVDHFDPGPEYRDHWYYGQMDFRWSSENEMRRENLEQAGGWVPVTEALNRSLDIRNGQAVKGTMQLVCRPKALTPHFEQRRRERILARMGESATEDAGVAADFDSGKMAGRTESASEDPRKAFDAAFRQVVAGGSSKQTDHGKFVEFQQQHMERMRDAARGKATFGGFDGPANHGAVKDSPNVARIKAALAAQAQTV